MLLGKAPSPKIVPGHTYCVLPSAPAPGANSLVCSDGSVAEDKFHNVCERDK